MQPTTKFCTQCGAPLAADARFCGACGSPVRAASESPEGVHAPEAVPARQAPEPGLQPSRPRPPFAPRPVSQEPIAPAPAAGPLSQSHAAPQAPAARGEAIVTMIPGIQRKKGVLGLGIDSFTLIGTPTRLIFTYLDTKTMNGFVNEARLNAKGQGKGWLGQVAAQMDWVNLMLDRLQNMGPDAVLAQYPGSFFIPNQGVSRVQVKQRYNSPEETAHPIEVVFDTTAGKQKFQVPTSMGLGVRDIKQRLQQVLGAIVR